MSVSYKEALTVLYVMCRHLSDSDCLTLFFPQGMTCMSHSVTASLPTSHHSVTACHGSTAAVLSRTLSTITATTYMYMRRNFFCIEFIWIVTDILGLGKWFSTCKQVSTEAMHYSGMLSITRQCSHPRSWQSHHYRWKTIINLEEVSIDPGWQYYIMILCFPSLVDVLLKE